VHRLNEIQRMVVGDKLQGVGDAIDDILLANHCHNFSFILLTDFHVG
jgi:hypothetical protein